MLLSLVFKVLFGERYDDFSRVLQSGIGLGHLLATPAASSSDGAHVFVVDDLQFSPHDRDHRLIPAMQPIPPLSS